MKHTSTIFALCMALTACAPEVTKEQPKAAQNQAATQEQASAPKNLNNQIIEIYPNQQLFVEMIIDDGKIKQVNPVAEIKNPAITLTLKFEPMGKGMILSVNNPLPKFLKYNIDMIDRNGKAYPTSSCPVMKGGSVYESWPHPIPKLQIKNFHLLNNEKELACTY